VTNVEIGKRLKCKRRYTIQKVMKRKVEFSGHIARMDNSWKIKSVVIENMNEITGPK